jgi:hypothetical protein
VSIGDSICLFVLSFAGRIAGIAGRIAGIASRLPLGFPRGPLSEFHIARLLLGLQAGLTSGSLGKLRGHLGSSLTP